MNKFTLIKENVNLGRFIMSKDQLYKYIRTVDETKNAMYPDLVTDVEGLKLLKALPYEQKFGRDFSILNKVNTNRSLMFEFVKQFQLNSFDDLINFIKTNKDDIFNPDGRYFPLVWKTIRKTEELGEENEELVVKYIKALTKSIYNIDIEPKREITSSYKDLIQGIDITFPFKGKEYTCQVKPLKSVNYSGNDFIVESSGAIKKYNTNYIAFSNAKNNQVMLFRALNARPSGNTFIIPKMDLVSAPDNIFDVLNKF